MIDLDPETRQAASDLYDFSSDLLDPQHTRANNLGHTVIGAYSVYEAGDELRVVYCPVNVSEPDTSEPNNEEPGPAITQSIIFDCEGNLLEACVGIGAKVPRPIRGQALKTILERTFNSLQLESQALEV